MTRAAAYRTLLIMLGVLVTAVVVAILPVDPPPEPVFDGTPITRYGYTISLVLFVIPVAALLTWFVRHRRRHPHWRPFWLTFAVIVGLWSALDVLLAHTFFEFPNQAATVGIDLPGYDPDSGWGLNVPVEEFLFYISGCAFVLIAYIWSGEVWFAAYTSSPEEYRSRVSGGLVLREMIHPRSLLVGVVAILAAIAYKKLGPHPHQDGFPGYLLFIVLMVIIPAATLFRLVLDFINLRAFLFSLQLLLLVALLWEVTLALPYGWWNYNPGQMVGIFVEPWTRLPIEAAVLWGAAAWSNIAIYEFFRLRGEARTMNEVTPP